MVIVIDEVEWKLRQQPASRDKQTMNAHTQNSTNGPMDFYGQRVTYNLMQNTYRPEASHGVSLGLHVGLCNARYLCLLHTAFLACCAPSPVLS